MRSGRNRILHHLGNHIQQFLLVIVDYKFDELKNMTKIKVHLQLNLDKHIRKNWDLQSVSHNERGNKSFVEKSECIKYHKKFANTSLL